jgi:two-component system, NtrC family, response regulator HydG
MRPTVLVVDDKVNMLTLFGKLLAKQARVVTARGVREAIAKLEEGPVSVIVCDLRMADGDGLAVLRAVQARQPGTPFILMTAYASVPTAVQAMREGAYDYVTKPFEPEQMRSLVERALAEASIRGVATGPGETSEMFTAMIGRSQAMIELFRMIERIAGTDATVMVLGETGSGKELVSRAIHERSRRAGKRLVAVNCAAIPRSLIESELFGHVRGSFTGAASDRAGLFEEADGGTLLLDEIGELRLAVQAKLTRAIEERTVRRIGDSRERKVDVRLIAATHRDLRAMVDQGAFREDLWFRLNVCVLKIPPLRDRREDILILAKHFLAERGPPVKSPALGFSQPAVSALLSYGWPGNVRELRSAVERAAIVETTPEIRLASLPEEVRGASAPGTRARPAADLTEMTLQEASDAARDDANRRYVESILLKYAGDVTEAAAHAGIERESLYRLMRRYGLTAQAFRREQK